MKVVPVSAYQTTPAKGVLLLERMDELAAISECLPSPILRANPFCFRQDLIRVYVRGFERGITVSTQNSRQLPMDT